MDCKERERLTLAYLDATENSLNVSEFFEDSDSPGRREAIDKSRQACEKALAALKLHIREHKC